MKLLKIIITIAIFFIIVLSFVYKIINSTNNQYIWLIPTFIIYIFIPLTIVLNLIIKNNK